MVITFMRTKDGTIAISNLSLTSGTASASTFRNELKYVNIGAVSKKQMPGMHKLLLQEVRFYLHMELTCYIAPLVISH